MKRSPHVLALGIAILGTSTFCVRPARAQETPYAAEPDAPASAIEPAPPAHTTVLVAPDPPPPLPTATRPPPTVIVTDERSEREDEREHGEGRGVDLLWVEVEGGVSYVDLIAMQNRNFSGGVDGASGGVTDAPSFREVRGTGGMFAAGGGFRIWIFALGVRGTIASYPDAGFDIGTFGGELQLRLPTPVVEPYLRVGAGYAWQGNVEYASGGAAKGPHVDGWTLDGALGIDVFVTWWLTLGIGGQVDFLNMTRQRDPTATCMRITDFCPNENGDAVGLQARGFLQLGIHL